MPHPLSSTPRRAIIVEHRELKYFVALAEELHFARAAARVGIEQSPPSKAISEMERHLGVQLFVRTRRRTHLTDAGRILLRDARPILAAVEQARCNVRSAALGRQGRLRIAFCDGVPQYKVARLVDRICREMPDVEIRLVYKPLAVQLRDLHEGMLDLGFAPFRIQDKNLMVIPLWNDELMAVMRHDHPLAADAIDLQSLGGKAERVIVLGEPASAHVAATCRALSAGIPPAVDYAPTLGFFLTVVIVENAVGLAFSGAIDTQCLPNELTKCRAEAERCASSTFLLRRGSESSGVVCHFASRASDLSAER